MENHNRKQKQMGEEEEKGIQNFFRYNEEN